MSTQANFNCFDGALTPIAHSMLAMGTFRENGVQSAVYEERITGVPFDAQVSVVFRDRTLKDGTDHVQIAVKFPQQEVVTGSNAAGYSAPPAVAYEDTAVVNFYFNGRTTSQNRRTIRQFIANLINGVVTTQTVTTTGAVPELVDLGINPA